MREIKYISDNEKEPVDSYVEFTSYAPSHMKNRRIAMLPDKRETALRFDDVVSMNALDKQWTISKADPEYLAMSKTLPTINRLIKLGKAREYNLVRFLQIQNSVLNREFFYKDGTPNFRLIIKKASELGIKVSESKLMKNYIKWTKDKSPKDWGVMISVYKLKGGVRNRIEISNV